MRGSCCLILPKRSKASCENRKVVANRDQVCESIDILMFFLIKAKMLGHLDGYISKATGKVDGKIDDCSTPTCHSQAILREVTSPMMCKA
jgi:hypothetical protein